jgi:hypothetical protein
MSDNDSSQNKKTPPTTDEIAMRAYGYYQQENFPENRDLEHWYRAERELTEERSSDTPPSPWTAESGSGT